MNADVSGDALNISIRDKVEIIIYNVLGQKSAENFLRYMRQGGRFEL